MQEVSAITADQEGATEQDEVFEDALDTVTGFLDMDQDRKVKIRQVITSQLQSMYAKFNHTGHAVRVCASSMMHAKDIEAVCIVPRSEVFLCDEFYVLHLPRCSTVQMMVRPGQVEECLAAFHGKIEAQEDHISIFEYEVSRKMQQKMDQLEMNCNANIGEAVAAGIEEIQESTVATGGFPLIFC